MIIGVLGKGGSGKSTVSTQLALTLSNSIGNSVLAIDADHNLDLWHNLTANTPVLQDNFPFLGNSLHALKDYIKLSSDQSYTDVFLQDIPAQFSLTPPDQFTGTFSRKITPNLHLMAAGPQTDQVLYGKACSHILTTPLKTYLPLLQLRHNEVVIVDEKAGADGVTTGIVTGIDLGLIICEPSSHSIKTARQIASLMEFYETPFFYIGNKVNSREDESFISKNLMGDPVTFLPTSTHLQRTPDQIDSVWQTYLTQLLVKFEVVPKETRLERTKRKFVRNHQFTQ
jgi:CO dehydrogenase nickel-insertion accessory protein CooC1